MEVPRHRELPDDDSIARLERAVEGRRKSDAELRAAVVAAVDRGGSVRAVAEMAHLSTRTIQNWIKDRGSTPT